MGRPKDADQKDSSNPSGDGTNRRRTRRRRRTILNLGIPFVQVDDFLNQSEDAVALGYRVLEDTVEEIKRGYHEAQEFNRTREAWNGEGLPPPVPWEQIVNRAQTFQKIALRAVRDGAEILFESVDSGAEAMKSAARTWEKSRSDVEANPVMAGPVIDEPIVITVRPGESPEPERRKVRHRGLARLRIYPEMSPPLMELVRLGADKSTAKPPVVRSVTFEPASADADEEFSVLTVDLEQIPWEQKAADYEGLIKAKNFDLLIATLRVTVAAGDATQSRQPGSPTQTPPRSAGPTAPAGPGAPAGSAVPAGPTPTRPSTPPRDGGQSPPPRGTTPKK